MRFSTEPQRTRDMTTTRVNHFVSRLPVFPGTKMQRVLDTGYCADYDDIRSRHLFKQLPDYIKDPELP